VEGAIHIDKALTDVSVAYANGDFVADFVAPPVPADDKSGKYYVHGKERFRVRDDRRSPGGEARRSRFSVAPDSYDCTGHALMDDSLAREDQANADPALDLMIDTTEQLTEEMKLNKDSALVTMLVAGMTGTSLSDIQATPWNADANDPVKAIKTQAANAQKRIGRRPRHMTISQPVWDAISVNAKVTARITGAPRLGDAQVTVEQFAALCDLEEIRIASALYDTANEGQAASLDYVWTDRALLFYKPQTIGRKMLSLVLQMFWRKAGLVIGGANVGGQFVRRWFEDRRLVDVVEVNEWYDLKLITKDAGCLFDNCLG
jgi:hypothetical protein